MKSTLVALLAVGIIASIAVSVGSAINSDQPAGASPEAVVGGLTADAVTTTTTTTPATAAAGGEGNGSINDDGDDAPTTTTAATATTTATVADDDDDGGDDAPTNTDSATQIHFTRTVTSSQDPGLGHEDHQLSFILSPNEGTVYDGSMTFVSSMPVQVFILHEISAQDARGQLMWTVDGETMYALSIVDVAQQSGSIEFTGAALGLHSASGPAFTATASVDGWMRGQSTEVIIQKIVLDEEPASLLSRTGVPATIPMHKGLYDGQQVLYIITDGSDDKYAEMLSKRQGWKVEHAPVLANVPDDIPQKLFVFKNGLRGDGIYGFQDEVFSATPSQESKYAALGAVIEVTWKPGQRHTLFESAEDVTEAQEAGRIKFDETGIILNAPQIVWPDGQMAVRPDGVSAVDDDDDDDDDDSQKQSDAANAVVQQQYGGGQIIEIDEDGLAVTFMAHRGWGPDGRTVYHIVTDATPQRPAETMGVTPSPVLDGMTDSPVASDLFYFKNGIRGSGQLGFQPGVSAAAPGDEDYTPIGRVYLVEWNDAESARILETKSDIDSFKSDEMILVSLARPLNSNYVVNAPLIDPFQ